MKKISYGSMSIVLTGIILVTALYGAAKWEQVKSGSGVTVYTRDVQGSDLDEFMGVTYINLNISIVLAVLQDIPSQTKWMHNCIAAKLIHKKNDYERIVYNATNLPWPVSDRDVVVKTVAKVTPAKGTAIISIRSISDSRAPKTKDRVRMPKLRGSWNLYYLAEGKTKVVYKMNANPGGSIPSSIANMSSKDIPYNTLRGLKRMVKKAKYATDGAILKKQYGKGWMAYK